jgi:hypothetical protein
MKEINLTIAGGCFTEQHNIAFDKLYHQTVKHYIENIYGSKLNINIIRYERFSTFPAKLKKLLDNNVTEVLLFHVRSEQFLRLSKLYYKYSDDKGKIKYSLNFPALKINNPEKHDIPVQIPQSFYRFSSEDLISTKKSLSRKIFSELNYIAGILSGNSYVALKEYMELIYKVSDYCKEKDIQFILAGPASRPNTLLENYLTDNLHNISSNYAARNKIHFISCLGKFSENGEYLFFKNGIHVNEAGHRRIAEKIIIKLIEIFSPEETQTLTLIKNI